MQRVEDLDLKSLDINAICLALDGYKDRAYNHFFKCADDLAYAGGLLPPDKRFPDYKERLIQPVLNNPEHFQRLFGNSENTRENLSLFLVVGVFPEYACELFAPVIRDVGKANVFFSAMATTKHYADPAVVSGIVGFDVTKVGAVQRFLQNSTALLRSMVSDDSCGPNLVEGVLESFPPSFNSYKGEYNWSGAVMHMCVLIFLTVKAELWKRQEQNHEKDVRDNDSSGVKTNTHSVGHVNHNGPSDVYPEVPDPNKQMCDAVITAVTKYLDWSHGRADHRGGAAGYFSGFFHGGNGRATARKFTLSMSAYNAYEENKKIIDDFLNNPNTHFNNHSFSSFLLDELARIENSPWAKPVEMYPQYRPSFK